MKKAIGYIRISDKDQSHFSLDGQEKYIRSYADQQKMEVIDIFIDDGRSAKNFDRPDWKKMEAFIKDKFYMVDFLIVAKYDRFSRNAADGLKKIETLEKKYGIIILSVFEQMHVDSDSPFFFKQRADMLVNAEFEWHVIRDRTRFGIHNALSQGRYVSRPPYGYISQKDEKGRPVIVQDPQKAAIVRMIFMRYLQGVPTNEILKEAVKAGFTNRGRSAVQRVLSQPVYGGLIFVPTYRKEMEHYVQGMHEGIISAETWHRIQAQLNGRAQVHTIFNESVPMRGVLRCFCGKPLTAGNSKGKKKYYWYYKCLDHTAYNLSANKLHDQFDQILQYLSLRDIDIQYMRNKAAQIIDDTIKERVAQLTRNRKELSDVKNKIDSLEEKFINDHINSETYRIWYTRFQEKQNALLSQNKDLDTDISDKWTLIQDNIHKLGDLQYLYTNATIAQKQSFIKMVFNSSLYYQDGIYRTPYLLPLLSHNALILNEKRLLIIEQPANNFPENTISAPGGT